MYDYPSESQQDGPNSPGAIFSVPELICNAYAYPVDYPSEGKHRG